MLIAVRHGSTAMNGKGGEGDKMRGWLPLPLSDDGRQEVKRTADKLQSLGINDLISKAYTSDLPRAIETSKIIAPAIGVDKLERTRQLRDWNVGDYTGKSVKKNLSALHSYIDNPDDVIPGGESYQQFYDRVTPFLRKLVESDDTHVAVTHNRIMTLLAALAKGKGEEPDDKILKEKGPVDPGGIMMIDPDWSIVDKINV